MTTPAKTLDLTFGLEGKVAMVTGGASGIGAAVAEADQAHQSGCWPLSSVSTDQSQRRQP